MGKAVDDVVLDAAWDKVADLGDNIYVCSGEPGNFAAIAALLLVTHAMTEGDGNGDYTIANAAGGGRKLTITAQAAVTITNAGTATHIVIADLAGSQLLYVTTCTSQALTAGGNTVTIPAWTASIGDPT